MSSSLGRMSDSRGRPPPLRLAHSAPGSAADDIPLHGPPSTKPFMGTSLQSPISPVSPNMSLKSRRLSSSNPPPIPQRTGRRRTSATPPPDRISAPAQRAALDEFAESCRAFFYHNDTSAEDKMTRRLAALPAHEKRQYTKVQASIRAAFHRDAATRRKHEFRAHLTSVAPGGSLSPAARASPRGREAASERCQRFTKFVENWCSPSFPGTSPFFDALWAVMSLQTLPVDLGGAGPRLLEWEIDDAVFQEAAGKNFMFDAIDVLKGVLAFEPSMDEPLVAAGSEPLQPSQSQGQRVQIRSTTTLPAPVPTPAPAAGRPRAASDPFIDAIDDTPGLSHSVPSTVSSPRHPSALLPEAPGSSYTSASLLHSPATPPTELEAADAEPVYVPPAHHPEEGLGVILDGEIYGIVDDEGPEDTLRVWTAPDLTSHEYMALLAVFPSFVTSRKLPRLVAPPGNPARPRLQTDDDVDLEAGELVQVEPLSVRHGTGTIRLSERLRSPGWKSSWWRRFVSWWQHMFC